MSSLFVPLLLVLLALPLVLALMRANELFALRIDGGALRLVRGRIPPRLLEDIGDVLRRGRVDSAELRAVVEGGRPSLRVSRGELSPAVTQRLRNTISLWPVAKIRNAPRRS